MENIKIKNALGLCVIDIEGTIGVAEEWQFDHVDDRVETYEKFRETLAQIETLQAEKIVVNIRSTGGDVNDAILIYEALTSLKIPITTRCYGYVASAATVIAQAASEGERMISTNTLYLVHNSTCAAEGNASELSARVDLLRKTDERLSELYARRSGRSAEEFLSLMGEEGGNGRWLNAEEAVAAGLADKVIDLASDVEKSSIQNFWRRIGEKLGLTSEEAAIKVVTTPSNDTNILHDDEIKPTDRQAKQAFEQQQKAYQATQLKAVEDPSLTEVAQTSNQKAYSNDTQAFRNL